MQTKNHETHLVMLWIDNVESVHNYWLGRAGRIYNDAPSNTYGSKYDNAKYELAEAMKNKFTNDMHNMMDMNNVNGLWSDLLCSSLGDVNWFYIAECYLSHIEFALEKA